MTYSYRQGMAWSSPAPAATQTTSLQPSGPSCQPCPDCGGLECLCRPRFFAGQLLTEQDLNRLESYIIAKNRLHNRYLVGHGVVCGLDITCSPCANTIGVSPGYAIDPCGNDIIVCSPDTVDVCKLIKACTPTTAANCAPYKDTSACADATQTWIVAIRYAETPSRGVTPLTGSSSCGCGATGAGNCSCGSGKNCGCGGVTSAASCCGETISPATPVATNLPRRGAPSSCEPTVTCEGYRYEVFLAPSELEKRSLIGGELLERLQCCFQSILPNGLTVPTDQQNQQQWYAFCCSLRQALIQYLTGNGGSDCRAMAKLQAISCPAPNSESFWNALGLALEAEIRIFFEILLDCFCTVALPPCPWPGDPRVPLAAVTVRASDCTILSICDWTPLRKHVVTTKTLGYWFGWLPFAPLIREFMLEVCCNTFSLRNPRLFSGQGAFAPQATKESAVGTPEFMDEPISLATKTYDAGSPMSEAVAANLAGGTQALTLGDLLHAMLDPIPTNATADTLRSAPRAKVLAEATRPLFSAFGPLLSAATGALGATGTTNAANAAMMTSMRAELDSLRATVATQQSAIDALRQSPPNRG
jgi:hypothetical protein